MNRHVNAIAGRLSLRAPQRRSLEVLDRITEIAPPKKGADIAAALEAIRSEFPSVTDFEREFPSLCFALATGVGKTRLMGAFISYLHLAHGINNFFVMAPNLTIYNKLIADFTPNTPKYVFKGIAEFATEAPEIITGDNYEAKAGTLFDELIRCHQRDIARFIHAQMQAHYWEDVSGYEVRISKGYTELRQSAYSFSAQEPPMNYKVAPADKSNMSKYLFGGFERCLFSVQKFDSDTERILAMILERDAIRWFKPAKSQFQIFYRQGADHLEYQPDFVAEAKDMVYMLEPKMRKEMTAVDVLAKKEAAQKWCVNASAHAQSHAGKKWRYALIPHDVIAVNMTLDGLVRQSGR